jgi:hypothetical protein
MTRRGDSFFRDGSVGLNRKRKPGEVIENTVTRSEHEIMQDDLNRLTDIMFDEELAQLLAEES